MSLQEKEQKHITDREDNKNLINLKCKLIILKASLNHLHRQTLLDYEGREEIILKVSRKYMLEKQSYLSLLFITYENDIPRELREEYATVISLEAQLAASNSLFHKMSVQLSEDPKHSESSDRSNMQEHDVKHNKDAIEAGKNDVKKEKKSEDLMDVYNVSHSAWVELANAIIQSLENPPRRELQETEISAFDRINKELAETKTQITQANNANPGEIAAEKLKSMLELGKKREALKEKIAERLQKKYERLYGSITIAVAELNGGILPQVAYWEKIKFGLKYAQRICEVALDKKPEGLYKGIGELLGMMEKAFKFSESKSGLRSGVRGYSHHAGSKEVFFSVSGLEIPEISQQFQAIQKTLRSSGENVKHTGDIVSYVTSLTQGKKAFLKLLDDLQQKPQSPSIEFYITKASGIIVRLDETVKGFREKDPDLIDACLASLDEADKAALKL